MKKILILLLATTSILSCKKVQNDYVTFSGKIENTKDSILTISNKVYKKEIKLNKDGSFSDTLKVGKSPIFGLQTNNNKRAPIFLRNGYELVLKGTDVDFMNSFEYSGEGASSNNFILSQVSFQKTIGNPMDVFSLEKEAFTKKVASFTNGIDSIIESYSDVDTMLVSEAKKQQTQISNYFTKNYAVQHTIAKQTAVAKLSLAKGKPSPKFNYMNYKGGKLSLDSFKGKYVYIDVWATWCKPCLAEIPALKILEKKYHNKNIQFISLSIDDERTSGTWDNAISKWKEMIKTKNLTGVQLFAGKDVQFINAYQVSSIPRFILIDPKGNIVDANAPRPSDPNLEKTFNELGI